MRQYLNENPDANSYPDITKICMKAIRKDVKERLDVFGSSGKCDPNNTTCLSCGENNCGVFNNEFVYDDLVDKISREVLENIKNTGQ